MSWLEDELAICPSNMGWEAKRRWLIQRRWPDAAVRAAEQDKRRGDHTPLSQYDIDVAAIKTAVPNESLNSSQLLAAARSRVWGDIKADRERRTMTGGYLAAGKWWHSDQLSRSQQSDMFMAGSQLPTGIMWKTMDGSFIEVTPAIASEVFAAKATSDRSVFAAAEAHRIAMESLEDPTTYDFSNGWPPSYVG